jgi:uncharacterized MAPEG superfamily protein
MTTDLLVLVWTAVWTFVLLMVPAAGRLAAAGGAWGLGNRDTQPEVAPWVGRAERASRNMLENLGPFTVLVIVAYAVGVVSPATALACKLFLAARVAHAFTYIAGIPGARTVAFIVGVAAEVALLVPILRAPWA